MKTDKPQITLTGAEIVECLRFLGADDAKLEDILDEDGLETPVTIAQLDEWKDKESGETMPAGKYVYFEEYPEEGVHGPLAAKEGSK